MLELFDGINLFEDQEENNRKYINAIEAINLIADKTHNTISNVSKFLLIKDFASNVCTYTKDYLGVMGSIDSQEGDIPFMPWHMTNDFLNKGLENFDCNESDLNKYYEKSYYEGYYWLKDDFFSFDAVKKLEIDADYYNKYLLNKAQYAIRKLAESQKVIAPPHIKALFDKKYFTIAEASLFLYWIDDNRQCHFDREPDKHSVDMIMDSIADKSLSFNWEYELMTRESLQKFLSAHDREIDGFNDRDYQKTVIQKVDEVNQKYPIEELSPGEVWEEIIKNKNQEVDQLKADLTQAQERIKQLEEMQYSVNENATLEEEISLQDSDLLLVSVLLKMLQSEIKVKSQQSQSKILQKIENSYGYMGGLSKSRTEKLMKEANGVYKRLNNKEMK